jgi:hypothetical protein
MDGKWFGAAEAQASWMGELLVPIRGWAGWHVNLDEPMICSLMAGIAGGNH